MKARVCKAFYDKLEDVPREPGDVFELTEERFQELEKGLARFCVGCTWVEQVEEEEEPKKAAKPKKSKTKKE